MPPIESERQQIERLKRAGGAVFRATLADPKATSLQKGRATVALRILSSSHVRTEAELDKEVRVETAAFEANARLTPQQRAVIERVDAEERGQGPSGYLAAERARLAAQRAAR
jgi:hypothetical protein